MAGKRTREIMLLLERVDKKHSISDESGLDSSIHNTTGNNSSLFEYSTGYKEVDIEYFKENTNEVFPNGERIEENPLMSNIIESDFDDDIGDPDYVAEENSSAENSENEVQMEQVHPSNKEYVAFSKKEQNPLNGEIAERIKNKKKVANFTDETDDEEFLPLTNEPDLKDIDLDHKILKLDSSKSNLKKHFCVFCKTLQTKLARHLENKHKNEERVKVFWNLPKKSFERLQIIDELRKEGDSLYNSDKRYNRGEIIVVRRPQAKKQRNADHYMPCGKCSAMYSILSLRAHYKTCNKSKEKTKKDVLFKSRMKGFVNKKANTIMKLKILPPMRQDEINSIVRAEDLIITFGNRLTQTYRSPHLFKMIRSRLRCVARFYWHFKMIKPEIKNFENVFDPSNYDIVIQAINKMTGLNESTGQYRAPATAACIGSYLKKISLYLVSEMIKRKDSEKLEDVRNFLQLLEDGLTYDIFKTVNENQLDMKRNKVIRLPSIEDISLLRDHLESLIKQYYQEIKKKFSLDVWTELASAVLIALQVFNRRRVGEIERIKIQDFLQYESVDRSDEMSQDLDLRNNEKYVRFLIRGKRGRGVPVLVDKMKLICLKTIIKFRKEANVPGTNPYLFGIDGRDDMQHLDGCRLIARYAQSCGAKNPERLKGTELRKHFATKCGTMDLKGVDIKDIADYMGHHEKIHLEHYRMPNATTDIHRMSEILEKAQGIKACTSNSLTDETFEVEQHQESICLERTRGSSDSKSTTPKTRTSWNKEERDIVNKEANFYLENFESPTLSYCKSLIKKQPSLRRRTPVSLKAFIMNEIKKKKENFLNPSVKKCKRGIKKYWSEQEKDLVLCVLKENLKNKTLPSLKICRQIIAENEILKERTPEMLKAFISNTFKKKSF